MNTRQRHAKTGHCCVVEAVLKRRSARVCEPSSILNTIPTTIPRWLLLLPSTPHPRTSLKSILVLSLTFALQAGTRQNKIWPLAGRNKTPSLAATLPPQPFPTSSLHIPPITTRGPLAQSGRRRITAWRGQHGHLLTSRIPHPIPTR